MNATLGRIRVQDNRVTECLCGFWLCQYGSLASLSAAATATLDLATSFWEIQYSLDLGPIYELPSQASTTGLRQAVLLVQGTAVAPPASIPPAASIPSPVATHPASIPPPVVTPPRPRIVTMAVMPAPTLAPAASAPAASIPPSTAVPDIDTLPLTLKLVDQTVLAATAQAPTNRQTMTITNNGIEAIPGATKALCSIALLVVNQGPSGNRANQYANSLIIASNNVHGSPPVVGLPVAAVMTVGPTAVTGNLFVSEANLDDREVSLLIYTESGENAELLAVTGNVLVGRTNLVTLTRNILQQPAMNDWRLWNTLTNFAIPPT